MYFCPILLVWPFPYPVGGQAFRRPGGNQLGSSGPVSYQGNILGVMPSVTMSGILHVYLP